MCKSKEKPLEFRTGKLSAEEVRLILDTVPIDITFVGKSGEVKYFNKPESRIFKRRFGKERASINQDYWKLTFSVP